MKSTNLSSSLTLFYKFIIPMVFTLGFMALVVSTYTVMPQKYFDGMRILCLVFLVGSPILLLFVRLVKIKYDGEKIYIDDFFKTKDVKLDRILKVESNFVYFYKITYKDDSSAVKKIYFLPSLFDRMMNIFKTPKSVLEFRSILNKV